jgi:thiamine-monophosphate kinase
MKNVPRRYAGLARVHLSASPRIEEGRELAANPLVHAMIDVSDGISKECRTLSFENGMGIVLDGPALEGAGPLRELAAELGVDAQEWVLNGGGDYELLFAASPRLRPPAPPAAVQLTRIGKFTGEVKGVRIRRRGGPLERIGEGGWDHLRKAARGG